MKLRAFEGPGSTPARRGFWDAAFAAVKAAQKRQGRHVTVSEHQGMGTFINMADTSARRPVGPVTPTGACCVGEVCSITTAAACADLGGDYQGDGTPCDPNPCLFTCSDAEVTAAISFTFTGGGTCHGGFCGNSCSETFGDTRTPVDNEWTWIQATCGGQEVQISVVLYCQLTDDPGSEFFPFKGYYLIFQYGLF